MGRAVHSRVAHDPEVRYLAVLGRRAPPRVDRNLPDRSPAAQNPVRLGDDLAVRRAGELAAFQLLLRPALRIYRMFLVGHRILPLAR